MLTVNLRPRVPAKTQDERIATALADSKRYTDAAIDRDLAARAIADAVAVAAEPDLADVRRYVDAVHAMEVAS